MKRKFLIVPIFLMATCLSGCSPQVTPVETITHEAGEALPEDVLKYATFKHPERAAEATLDLSNVVADKVGTYEATITLKEKDYSVTINVVDTNEPDGTYKDFLVLTGKDSVVTPDMFGLEFNDISEILYGFNEIELYKTEKEVSEIIAKNIKVAEETGIDKVTAKDLLGVTWEKEKDFRIETEFDLSKLKENFVPDETGLYKLETCIVDEHGNANVANFYVLADLEEPEFKELKDIEFTVTSDFNEYMKSLNEGLKVEDNFMGDITYAVTNTQTEILKENSSSTTMKLTYEVTDMVGNIATAERTVKVNAKKSNIQVQPTNNAGQAVAEGFNRSMAEQAFAKVNEQRSAAGLGVLAWDENLYDFACNRSQQIVSNFSHYLPDGSEVSDYLLNVGGAYGYGENIASNYKSITNLINGWMNSQGHKENILDPRFNAGVMACYGYGGTYYWVNLFEAN